MLGLGEGLGLAMTSARIARPRSSRPFLSLYPMVLTPDFGCKVPMGPADELFPESGVPGLSLCHTSALVAGQLERGDPLRTI